MHITQPLGRPDKDCFSGCVCLCMSLIENEVSFSLGSREAGRGKCPVAVACLKSSFGSSWALDRPSLPSALRKGIQVLIQISDYMGLRAAFVLTVQETAVDSIFWSFSRFVILKSNLLKCYVKVKSSVLKSVGLVNKTMSFYFSYATLRLPLALFTYALLILYRSL